MSGAEDPARELCRELRREWGIDFGQIRALIGRIADGRWHTVPELVQATALSHRTASDLVRRLSPWLETDGERLRIRAAAAGMMASSFACQELAAPSLQDPYEAAAAAHPALDAMARLASKMPRPDPHLDHVSATPRTCIKRALFLADQYDLEGAEILFLGDHDLTSLALAHLLPELAITVVDVDERILAYICGLTRERGWNLRTLFADLRVDLPHSATGRFDLVFTDPPYTPAGIRLFLKRGIDALKEHEHARLLFCYGFGERQPGLGFKAQSVLHELRLATEAVLPRFNRYVGAEAVGSASALYVCRPTRRTRPAARTAPVHARIYTRGRDAMESDLRELPPEVVASVRAHLGGAGEPAFVGDGWPDSVISGAPIPLSRFLQTMLQGPGKPPFGQEPHSGAVAVDLFPRYGRYLLRVLLASAAGHLVACAPDRDLHWLFVSPAGEGLRLLVESAYRLDELIRGEGDGPGLAVLERIDPPAGGLPALLRYIVDHRRARLGSAWREGLIAGCARSGEARLTKNQARERIRESGFPPAQLQNFLTELPLADLESLAGAAARTLEVRAGSPDPNQTR